MLSFKVNELVTSLCKKELVIKLKEIFDYFTNKGDYDIFCEIIENYILDDYSRATNETVKIICEDDEEVEITLFQFLINLYFLEFNFMYKIPITRDWMQDIDVNFLKDYHKNLEKICQEKIYPIIEKKKINSEECFSFILSHITERMEQLSELLATISSPTISIIDLIEFCGRNKEFDNLLNTTLDDTKSSAQLEAQLKEDGQKLFDIILKDENSCLFPFVQSNCLSVLQLTQMFIAVGPRMSINNIVLPHIMKRSYLNGLQNVGDQIAESELAAKALIGLNNIDEANNQLNYVIANGKKLAVVQEKLKSLGYRIKLWDAYRPFEAQKKLWEVCPDPRYIANPANGMKAHNLGGTIDMTIVTLEGEKVEMPSGFDEFSVIADRDYSDVSEEARNNAVMLEQIMTECGFEGYEGEWWDYSDTTVYEPMEFEP